MKNYTTDIRSACGELTDTTHLNQTFVEPQF
ncbi:uncharacterized protein PITG_19014 [Phytophthora infestans T30-4]|uniref:Uncharacterized protein n=1 Tax=Phytophthora infestans (strain T30-4) TaxID=403677 RepID=D0NYR9_PHYIT|nr:uncharacterized protein PITG_19014 [Phytophthora infestans T30-4]EEY68698.1 hypothetical protein PITG_19014 [Phytophthora infestans T30-4]|eukprot:XP_002997504.1 hypothetical protein PITG_19014 [Phytophthora infestans T30-4]